MKRNLLLTCILTLLMFGCTVTTPTPKVPATAAPATQAAPAKPTAAGVEVSPCGDGVCSGPESARNCPADCTGSSPTATPPPGDTPTSTPDQPAKSQAPLYMTTMTHMEGNFTDDRNEAVFLRHVEELRYGMDLAAEYGALLTIESEKPFARANTQWQLNLMAEIRDRGFGVGTHCDIGYKEPLMPPEQYARLFVENKTLVDGLIGAENNLGCSGGGSSSDWALAASQAGFKYLDGIVGVHYLSMPLANRPDSTWTDEAIRGGLFHLNAPVDLAQRFYLFGVANAQDFVPDANPVIVVSSGELGLLSAIAEHGREFGGVSGTDETYAFDNADIDTLVTQILALDQTRDRSRIAKVTVYFPAAAFVPENEGVLRYFFEQMQALAEGNTITWATQRQAYEAYVAWKAP